MRVYRFAAHVTLALTQAWILVHAHPDLWDAVGGCLLWAWGHVMVDDAVMR